MARPSSNNITKHTGCKLQTLPIPEQTVNRDRAADQLVEAGHRPVLQLLQGILDPYFFIYMGADTAAGCLFNGLGSAQMTGVGMGQNQCEYFIRFSAMKMNE